MARAEPLTPLPRYDAVNDPLPSGFTNPYGVAIRPPRHRESSSPETIVVRNESLGLAIDCETATAHWHGERIDYDHALMVAMASWDSGDTRPEAGPAAGDWNPS